MLRASFFIPLFLFLGKVLTVNRRKSFWCDSKNLHFCFACYMFRAMCTGSDWCLSGVRIKNYCGEVRYEL